MHVTLSLTSLVIVVSAKKLLSTETLNLSIQVVINLLKPMFH